MTTELETIQASTMQIIVALTAEAAGSMVGEEERELLMLAFAAQVVAAEA
jgi:hypothetical protein